MHPRKRLVAYLAQTGRDPESYPQWLEDLTPRQRRRYVKKLRRFSRTVQAK